MVVNKQMSLLAGPKPQKMGYSSPHDQLLVGFVWQSKRPLIISAVVTEGHALSLKPVLPIWLESWELPSINTVQCHPHKVFQKDFCMRGLESCMSDAGRSHEPLLKAEASALLTFSGCIYVLLSPGKQG